MTDGGAEIFEGRLPELVRTQLHELVRLNGAEILQDPRRVRAMLADTIATARREINLIALALREGVPERLQAVGSDPLRLTAEIEALTRQLEQNNALNREAAAWAVRSCAWSLGLAGPPAEFEPGHAPGTTPTTPPPVAPAPPASPIAGQPGPSQPGSAPQFTAPPATTPASSQPMAPDGASARDPAPQPVVPAAPPRTMPPPVQTTDADEAPPPPSADREPGTTSNRIRRIWPVATAVVLALIGLSTSAYAVARSVHESHVASPARPVVPPPKPTIPTPTPTAVSPSSTPTHTAAKPKHAPRPFHSLTLYDRFAKPYFRPHQCFVPRPSDLGFAFKYRDKEIVKCLGRSFDAAFWCKNNVGELYQDRAWYFHVAVPGTRKAAPGRPAGWRSRADGVQQTYLRPELGHNDGRVYWDSPTYLCAAEIQAKPNVSLARTIRFWHHGR